MCWSYYGSKGKIIDLYPSPLHNTIVEPFAGSARYSLKYFEKNVILCDKYVVIAKLWKWLQQCSPKDILSLPVMKPGETTDDFDFDCIEAKWLMGFMVNQGVSAPRKTVSKVFGGGRMTETIERDKRRIAGDLHKIKHWTIIQGDYSCISNIPATYFIDPPYFKGGEYYHSSASNKNFDYSTLADWAKSRNGQKIVCENSSAGWMDFKPLTEMSGSKKKTMEVMWHKES